MRTLVQVMVVAFLASCITSMVTSVVTSQYLMAAWKEEAKFILGLMEADELSDSMDSEMEVLRALEVIKAVESGDSDSLLTLACTSLSFELPNINPKLYSDNSDALEERKVLVADALTALDRLKERGVCFT